MSNLWKVSTDKFVNEKESIMRNGNVYQISNGYMGYRGTLDEFGAEQLVGITMAGIFDRVGDSWREPVNAPNGAFTRLTVDGKQVSALTSKIISHQQTIYLDNARFERETVFDIEGKQVKVYSSRILSIDKPNLILVKYSFSCNKPADIVFETGIDYNVWDLNGPHLLKLNAEKTDNVLLVSAITNENGLPVSVAEYSNIKFGNESHSVQNNYNLRKVELKAEAGKEYEFVKYVSVFKSGDPGADDVKKAAKDLVIDSNKAGYQFCLDVHSKEWKKRWDACDVVIEGDDEAMQALRYSIFQLLIVAPVKGSANSIPARALSGQVYKGAIFWDTEMFMFPFFLHTFPEVAVELMRYRIKTLDGARRKARTESIGFNGAFYAWESQETGDDACTYFNIGDPHTGRDLRTHFRDKQVHISGDVAIAMWEYFKLTGDDSLLLEGGAEVILECARFYYSYAYFKKDKNRYEILDVIGPDEYHERVNNNLFTNMVAKATFEIANATVNHMKQNHSAEFNALVKKINIADELPMFEEAAKLIYIPQPDEKTKVIEQFDAYFKLKDASIEELKSKMIHPNEYLGAGQGLAVPTKVIKQADVVATMFVFKDRFSTEIKKANWEYYEPKTEHGSSLSACAYAMVAAEFGNLDFAYNYFMKTAKIDIEAKYKVYVGTIFMGGSHPAANGGAWMTAVFGFAGLKSTADKIVVNPRLVEKWKSISFKVIHKNSHFLLKITKDKVFIQAQAENKDNKLFVVAGKEITIKPGSSQEISY